MTSTESFCYLALLKAPNRVSRQLNFLTEARRHEIKSVLNELRDATESELRSGWRKSREQEARQHLEITAKQTGLPISKFSAGLQRWFFQRFN